MTSDLWKPGSRYRVSQQLLGSGGSAAVYKAVDTQSGQEIAAKRLHWRKGVSGRAEREAALLMRLEHPSVIRCFGCFEGVDEEEERDFPTHGGYEAIALELAAGSVDAEVNARGALPADEARLHTADLVQALKHIHERGVTHCDVKLTNLLLCPDGGCFRLRLADFGVCATADSDCLPRGTAGYRTPEQIIGLKTRLNVHHIDVWQAGLCVATMLLGHRPCSRDGLCSLSEDQELSIARGLVPGAEVSPIAGAMPLLMDMFVKHRPHASVRSIRAQLAEVGAGEEMAGVAERMLHPDPSRRATAAEVACCGCLSSGMPARTCVPQPAGFKRRRVFAEPMLSDALPDVSVAPEAAAAASSWEEEGPMEGRVLFGDSPQRSPVGRVLFSGPCSP